MRRERMINRYVIISIVAVSIVIISAIGIIIANSSRFEIELANSLFQES